jgi:outer membrane protein assembly factor BamB
MYTSDLVLTADRIALLAGNKLWLLDRSGNVVRDVLDPEAHGAATVVADGSGNFYFVMSKVFSVTRDGATRWVFNLGSGIWTSSRMLLSPSGILYFAASDGYIYALRTSDGQVHWKQGGALRPDGIVRPVIIGVGDALFVDDKVYRAGDGTLLGSIAVNGAPVQPGPAWAAGFVAGRFVEVGDRLQLRLHLLGKCGQLLWSFPDRDSWHVGLVGKDDALLVRRFDGTNFWSHWYSATGALLDGPHPTRGIPTALGADGTVYSLECVAGPLGPGDMTVFAYAPDLSVSWSLPLGAPCNFQAAALADDGVLYIARDVSNGVEVVAVQTASPGLASTPWPTRGHDNGRTGWLGSAP